MADQNATEPVNTNTSAAGQPPAAAAPAASAAAPAAAGAPGADGKPASGAGNGDAAGAQGVPDKYEFQAPEGMPLDQAAVQAFEPIARELKLNNEQAQRLVDLYAGRIKGLEEQHAQQLEQQVSDWEKSVKGDKEIGGDAFDQNVQTAQKAIARFATPVLKQMLEASGLGSHPEIIRFCLRVGKAISEDTNVPRGEPAPAGRDPKTMYPNSQHA